MSAQPGDSLLDRCKTSGLDVDSTDAILSLILNRPQRRNVLDPDLVHCLGDALDWAASTDEIRCASLSGRGDSFCAGYDIQDIGASGQHGAERDLVDWLASKIESLPLPVVAAVNGPAIGGGCDLAVSCDIRIGSTNARFGMPPARLGVLYAVEGMRRLSQRAGDSTAREMLLTGLPIDASRAERTGLLSRVVEPAELPDRARELCDRLVDNAPLSVAGSKRSLEVLSSTAWTAAETEELAQIQTRVWHSEDALEGPRAFRERRTPEFLGQ